MDTATKINGQETWLRNQLDTWRKRAAAYTNLDWARQTDFISALIDFCNVSADWKALDLGTGPGTIAKRLSAKISHATGLDIAPEMIEQARNNHSDSSNVDFVIGNIEAMDLPPDSFDLVTARMVFHHVGDVPAGLSEAMRVLKPGGIFVLCEGVPPDHRVRERYERIFELKEERHTFSEADLINLFDYAGFEDILVRPFFMRHVSLNNWLQNGVLPNETIERIRQLHVDADDHFKTVYKMTESDGDVFMDWKFIMIRGRKPIH